MTCRSVGDGVDGRSIFREANLIAFGIQNMYFSIFITSRVGGGLLRGLARCKGSITCQMWFIRIFGRVESDINDSQAVRWFI